MTEPWWKSAVIYQIYPRSFCDSTGNGVGDLEGIINHLEHLSWLGVDAIWLSPVFTSPMVDHGYDVSNYCDIDPLFGDLDTFDRLVARCHEHGIRVILDWVPNHSSDQHPWFVDSRSSRDSAKRDWYIWRDGTPDSPPNNWQAEFPAGPAWAWDETTQAWYLHMFAPEQPDLNWANPEVREAMHATLRFWLDRGVDGFRMDVVHAIGKPDGLPDREQGPGQPLTEFDNAVTHDYLKDIRAVLDEYDGDRMAVGEVYLLDSFRVATYYGDNDELHLSFNFLPLWTRWEAEPWRKQIEVAIEAFDSIDAWTTWVLSNHDVPRHRSRYGGDERTARAAAVLLLCLRGTPFLYAGEELGLLDADVPPELSQDPAGKRDGCRAPIPWDSTETHGWVRPDNWLPFPPESETRNAETQHADPASMANLYREIITARRDSPALQLGSIELLPSPNGVLVFERRNGDDRRLVIVNMGNDQADISGLIDGWEVQLRTEAERDAPPDNHIPARCAEILRPSF
ncbi:MAG: alpha-amylase [Actinobacteria bacterium]|nr:MAG: alpha-amylase [Actinomycetota bacterium]